LSSPPNLDPLAVVLIVPLITVQSSPLPEIRMWPSSASHGDRFEDTPPSLEGFRGIKSEQRLLRRRIFHSY